MKRFRSELGLLVWLWAVASNPSWAENIPQRQPLNTEAMARSLFEPGKMSASFLLREANRLDEPSPEMELLDSTSNRQAIAGLLKEERNKGLKPGLVPPDDKNAKGIKVRFDGIRFLKDPKDEGLAWVRLVGPINEVQTSKPISIKSLLESDKPLPIQFRSVTNNTGVTVTITTDAELKWDRGRLFVSNTRGTIDFSVGLLSPARLLYSSDTDSVALPNLVGTRVSDADFPARSLLEPEKL